MAEKWMPREEWLRTMHRVPFAAGCLFLNEDENLLIGRKTRDGKWTIPGGIGEAGETPLQTALRETLEEIGIRVRKPRLICVHHITEDSDLPARMQYIFFGGMLSPRQATRIKLPAASEWNDFRFANREQAKRILTPDLAIKLRLFLQAVRKYGAVLYVETRMGEITHHHFA